MTRKTPNQTGLNRTGIKTSPIDSQKTERGAEESLPTSTGGELALAQVRLAQAEASEPIGSMPPPATVKGVAKTAATMLKGQSPTLFLNKLGERLAFERTGVRLYEALIDKLPAFRGDSAAMGPSVADLRSIQEDELRHVDVVRRAIETLGGDPTAMTPCADVAAVASSGILKVLADARTTLTQCLDAILIAELADNDAWLALADLADGLGMNELGKRFREALAEEEEHLARVRGWINGALLGQVGIAPTRPQPPAGPPAH